jgi:chitinase
MQKKTDFASDLSKLPVGPVGSGGISINVVNIAFADYTFSRDSSGRISIGYLNSQISGNGKPFDVDMLKSAIATLQAKGAKVKLAFGGATFSMSTAIKSRSDVDTFVRNVVEAVNQFNLDGVDFNVEDGNTSADLQVYLFSQLYNNLSCSKMVSYTIPAMSQQSQPYKQVIQQAAQYLSSVNIMAFDVYWSGYDTLADLNEVKALGSMLDNKLVWVVMIGCHDAPNEFTSVADASDIATKIKTRGFAGVSIWSFNRDTNHRTGAASCLYQTSQDDGSYIKAFSNAFKGAVQPPSPPPPPPPPTPQPPVPPPQPQPSPSGTRGQFVEAYWESWNMGKVNDYASDLSKIPMSAAGSGSKINIITIAFCDYSYFKDSNNNLLFGYINTLTGPSGQVFGLADLKAAVNAIHAKGGLVKVSFGGATFSMSGVITNQAAAETFVSNTATAVRAVGLDGVDFDIEDSATSSTLIIYTLRRLREVLGSGYIISLTVPALSYYHEPYKTTLQQGVQYVDYVSVMAFDVYWTGYDPHIDFNDMSTTVGVPKKKISWGVMPGCHDAANELTSLDDAKSFAKYVKANGMAGLMIWSANRDTDHRTGVSGCLYQTGKPDGSYANTMAAELK